MRTGAKIALGVGAALVAAYAAERIAVSRLRSRAGEPAAPWARPEGSTVHGAAGARLHVVEAGEGPPLVLSHGVGLAVDVWGDMFEPLVAAGFRVIAYDQRGHGRSTGGDDFSMARLAADLLAVLDARDARHGIVLGHSMGGLALQAMLTAHPELIRSLAGIVLVGTTPATLRVPAMLVSGASEVARRGLVERAFTSELHGTALTRVGFGRRPSGVPIEATRRMLAATPAATMAAGNSVLAGVDFRSMLPGFDVPALVISGRRDRVVPRPSTRWFAAGLPRAQVVELECGHMLPLEMPARLVSEVRQFGERLGLPLRAA